MYNKAGGQLLVIQDMIEDNRQYSDEKMKSLIVDLTAMITSMMDQITFSKSSPDKKDAPKDQYPTTVVTANKKSPPLEGVCYTKLVACGLSNMRSANQNYINSSSIQNSKATLIWTSRTSTTTSIFVSMQ